MTKERRSEIRRCACGLWKINVTVYPDPPEGLVDPCPFCHESQYAYFNSLLIERWAD